MEKTAIYAGSFYPFHSGHEDIVNKALKVFDKVYVAILWNKDKYPVALEQKDRAKKFFKSIEERFPNNGRVIPINGKSQTLKDLAKQLSVNAVVRGLRDGDDLAVERRYQYWNEDIGLDIPFFFIHCDRKLIHVSSSSIRGIEKLGFKHNY